MLLITAAVAQQSNEVGSFQRLVGTVFRICCKRPRVAHVRMAWWRWCSDDDGVGKRNKWAFDVADSPISPTRNWRLELRSWPVCRSRLDSRDHLARNPLNAVNLLWTLVYLSSGPPLPLFNFLATTSHLYAVFIIHFNKRRWLCFT